MEIEGDSERDFSESDLFDEEVEVNAYGRNYDRKRNLFTSHEAASSTGRFPLALEVGRPTSEARGKRPGDEVTHEGNFQHHFLSLFFARCPHQNYSRVSHAMAQLFQ